MFTLKVFRGDKVVQELDLDGPEVKIGRSPDNQVTLADDGKGVSRVHAFIRIESGDHVLYDANSRNGTYVDGKPIKRMVIQPGQEFVVGPYRLVFGSGEYSGGLPTVIAPRGEAATPAPPAPAGEHGTAQGQSRPGTTKGGQTNGAQGSTKSRPAAPSGKTAPGAGKPAPSGVKAPLPTAYVAVGAIAAIVVLGVVIWALLPDRPQDPVVVATTSIPTSIPETTTTIPPTTTIDSHAEPIAQATLAVEAAEAMLGEKRARSARTEFLRIIKELIAPILTLDPQYQPAIELEARARQGIAASEGLITTTTTIPQITPGPNDVAPRPNENLNDWKQRNAIAQQDYAMGTRLFSQGDYEGAIKVLSDLAAREPGWRDVSTYLRNAEQALAKSRTAALDEALRLEGEGHKLMTARQMAEAAATLLAARKAFERAAALQAPGVDKYIAENLARRRIVAQQALDLAYEHGNRRNNPEALKYFQIVIDVLPAGEPLRVKAEAARKKLAPSSGEFALIAQMSLAANQTD